MNCINLYLVILITCIALSLVLYTDASEQILEYDYATDNVLDGNDSMSVHHGSIHVAKWRFHYVKFPLLITAFIITISVVKVGFHHLHKVAEVVPESCMLIVLGLLVGLLFLIPSTDTKDLLQFLEFNSATFFLYMLPPIILEASYSLKDRAFFDNIGTILLYAIVGTILNIIFVGVGLIALNEMGAIRDVSINSLEILVFSSLIAAVDPVAVLALFQEVGVNKMLYYMVFGESLFNDAVTVVAFNLVVEYAKIGFVTLESIFLGFAAFLCVALVAAIIGMICGFLTALFTKYTSKIRVVEPTVLFGMAYLSYVLAELFHFSGIISIICCGLVQNQYACENISSKSYISVHYFSKVSSSVAESLIFIILGVMLVNNRDFWHEWSTSFSVYALILCFVCRYIVVFILTYAVNYALVGIRRISLKEQLVIGYGGLRGAVSFSLVFGLESHVVPEKNMLMGATYLIILFTVFVQGISMKPIIHFLNIRLKKKEGDVSMVQDINHAVIENILGGIEDIIGHLGTHHWTAITKRLSATFLRPMIQKAPHRSGRSLVATAQEISIQKKLERKCSSQNIPTEEALWNELQLLDMSVLPKSFTETVLDAQDDATQQDVKLRRRESKEHGTVPRVGTAEFMHTFRNALNRPFHKTVHYKAGDRNLRNDSSHNLRDLLHMQSIKRYNKRKFQPAVMGIGMLSAAIGVTPSGQSPTKSELHAIHEHEDEDEDSMQGVTIEVPQIRREGGTPDEKRPLFTAGPPETPPK